MNNKSLLILIILSLSVAAFLAGYLISQNGFTKQSANLSEGSILEKFDGNQLSGQVSTSGILTALSKRAVLSPTLSKEKNSVIYYDKSNGQAFEANPRDLSEKVISEKILPNLVRTIWSPNKKEVVSVFYDNNGKRFKYFNYQTQKAVDLGTAIKSLAFSPDGLHVAYLKSLGADGAIYVSAPDGSSPRKIIDTRLSDLEIYWPSPEYISFKTTADGKDSVYLLSMTGDLTRFLDTAGQTNLLWSSDGTRLLYSSKEDNSLVLSMKDVKSSEVTDLEVASPADKCAWGVGNAYIMCSVPKSGSGGEDIYKIDFLGNKELIASPSKNISASQLILTGIEDYIMIVNGTDGKIYTIKNK